MKMAVLRVAPTAELHRLKDAFFKFDGTFRRSAVASMTALKEEFDLKPQSGPRFQPQTDRMRAERM